VKHPAKFSTAVLEAMDPWLDGCCVLDPFAGVGGIHSLCKPARTVGVELEPEWAACHPRTVVGDATRLPFPDNTFDAVATSPAYGNRMADHHEATERCKACGGTGYAPAVGFSSVSADCERCEGAGRNTYKRHTYRHYLGRPLHERNSGHMQWGSVFYAIVHEEAWMEAARVLRPGALFLLNVKDHQRKGERAPVAGWHVTLLCQLGFTLLEHCEVDTPGMRHGQNHEARYPEQLYVLRLGEAA
jgi:hypothetical protein